MGKLNKAPRYNIVSLRVSDEEYESLLVVARELSLSISGMMRMALGDLARHREPYQLR